MTSEVFAPAKINLTLHVTGQRDDGYHLLDSLVVFADVGDRLTFTPAADTSLTVTGPFAKGVPTDRRNSVLRAAELVGTSCLIHLEKNLPHGAGIGGGSSDAAAVLRHFDRIDDALILGADVPVCLRPQAQRMQGIGEMLTVLPKLPSLFAVIINPGVHVPTPAIFESLSIKENAPMPEDLPEWETAAHLMAWLNTMRNDLQQPASTLAPEIVDVLDALGGHSACVRMSGSGATCFGLFDGATQANTAAEALKRDYPGWWVTACELS